MYSDYKINILLVVAIHPEARWQLKSASYPCCSLSHQSTCYLWHLSVKCHFSMEHSKQVLVLGNPSTLTECHLPGRILKHLELSNFAKEEQVITANGKLWNKHE